VRVADQNHGADAMATIDELKQAEICDTPIFLFDFALPGGATEHWSTHAITVAGQAYVQRVLRHNAFQLRASLDTASNGSAGLTVVLANADGICSEVEQEYGWKGTRVTVSFVFADAVSGTPTSDARVVFTGIADPVQEITESTCRLSFADRMSLQRAYVPQVRIQRQCPWVFPASVEERQEAVSGGGKGTYSRYYACGYSADVPGGCGNLDNGAAFQSCDHTRASCQLRGMWDSDTQNRVTRRFGGLEFVPSSILVRSYGDRSYHWSVVSDNKARYNDYVPLTYGTGWYTPPVVFARNDGNLTRMEVLLGLGHISGVLKVVVNNIEIPAGQPGTNMTATGWFTMLGSGVRDGTFDPDYTDGKGNFSGDPYGSMAYLSVVVPNRISDGTTLPHIDILIQGLQLQQYDTAGHATEFGYTNNPAWVLLDLLRRSGWSSEEIHAGAFATAAAVCSTPVQTADAHGNPTSVPAYSCNLLLTTRRSVGDVIRGIRTASNLYFATGPDGRLELHCEGPLGSQQGEKPAGTNSVAASGPGWPAYEFGDNAISGILRNADGSSSLRVYSRSMADTPNFVSIEFQDELNEYQQDSLSMFDADDAALCGQEITTALPAIGLSNFAQAGRVAALYLSKSLQGNRYVSFSTSFRAVSLNPGDLIAITYSKQNWTRQLFRVVTIAPDLNYRTAIVTAQIHDDQWYGDGPGGGNGRRQAAFDTGIPRPLIGSVITAAGDTEFGITEADTQRTDGSEFYTLSAAFTAPRKPAPSTAGIPLVSLGVQTSATGGTLPGGTVRYYAVSAVDSAGNESPLSFLVMAMIPAGASTNTVELQGMSFSRDTASFNVYRGTSGADLLQIATGVHPAPTFTDTGLPAMAVPPPDMNYDHANFYWRYELTPEAAAETHSSTTVGNSALQMTVNEFSGYLVRITGGTGGAQERTISSNTASTLTITGSWDTEPDSTSTFAVVEAGWRFGATGASGPISFDVPPTALSFVEICGRSANVRDEECAIEVSPVTRYLLGGGTADSGVPGAPIFGLDWAGDGTLVVAGIAFPSLTNTASITSGTFTIHFWDEFSYPTQYAVTTALTPDTASLSVNGPAIPSGTSVMQIESELVQVSSISPTGGLTITRGAYGTQVAPHATGTPVYPLASSTFVLPFVRNFFGSEASGDYSYTITAPHIRAAAAELFVTNSFGNSDVSRRNLLDTLDNGVRTLGGGQIALQIQGIVAVQTSAVPPLFVDKRRAIRDVYAVVGRAPHGGAVTLNVTVNGNILCPLTIADGTTVSGSVDGFGLGPIDEGAEINIDVTSVPGGADDVTASDLTVMIRF